MSNCPSSESIERLLAETLDVDERTRVETHVEECADCQKSMHLLTLAGARAFKPAAVVNTPVTGQDAIGEAFFAHLKEMTLPTPSEKPIGLLEIAGYQILDELGRGATGVVYRARHLKLNRLVALKVINAGQQLSPDARQRFRMEAMAIARLRHPNIVQVYDVGEQGVRPFLSLELVDGGSLADWSAGKPRPAIESARIIATLAKAVEYAHLQGVVHRDLKPSNVLLSVLSDRPDKRELKITDFGIAKVLPQSGIAEARMTQTGEILGTPAYMAPEQARGNASEICPATDVYSLGAMLYELLTSRPPFQGATALDTLMQAAFQDAVPIARLVPKVPRDLDTICLKCLEKESSKRYPSAAELADDLNRFLKQEPIKARPLSWTGYATRWGRRHKGMAASLSAVAFLLVLIAVGSAAATAHFRMLANEKGQLADEKEIARGNAVTAERRAQSEGDELRRILYFDQMNLAAAAAMSPAGVGRIEEWISPWANEHPDPRGWEWFYLNGLCHRDLRTLVGHSSSALHVAWSKDGKLLASSGSDGTVRLWNSSDGRQLRVFTGQDGELNSVAWSPNDQRLASCSSDGSIALWDAASGQRTLVLHGHAGGVHSVAWSPDGSKLATADDRTVNIWNAETGVIENIFYGETPYIQCVAWTPDGSKIAIACHVNAEIWDVFSGKELEVLRGHVNQVLCVAFSPDGSRVATSGNDRLAKIWDVTSGGEVATLRGHGDGVLSVDWSPDGSRVATCSKDQTIKVWSANGGAALMTFRGHKSTVSSVAWSPDRAELASASFDSNIKLWSLANGQEVPCFTADSAGLSAATFSTDGKQIVSGGADQFVGIWDVGTRRQQFSLSGHKGQIQTVAFNPTRHEIASAGSDSNIRFWNSDNGTCIGIIPSGADTIYCVAWSVDGKRLAAGAGDHHIRVWDAENGAKLLDWQAHSAEVHAVSWSPDGKRLASGSADHMVKIWDATTGKQTLSFDGHGMEVNSVAWSADGARLACGCVDQIARVWNAKTAELQLTLSGHTARVNSVAWNPNCTRLATASSDNTIKIWDAVSGSEALTLECGSGVGVVAWSPDGSALMSAADDGSIRLYDATPGYVAGRAAK